jgi:hypothetical protein
MMDEGDQILQATRSSLLDMQEQLTALLQTDERAGMPSGTGVFADFLAPFEVTEEVKQQLKRLPQTKKGTGSIWLCHISSENMGPTEGTAHDCTVYQVTKEYGSNGLPLPQSDGLGLNIAMCAKLDP